MQATVASFVPSSRTGSVLLDDGSTLSFGAAAFDASGLRLLRSGQRVRVWLTPTGDVEALAIATMRPLTPDLYVVRRQA